MLGIIRSPPTFSDDLAVTQDHDAVHALDLLVERVHKLEQRRGGNALRFGSAAGQQACGVDELGESQKQEAAQ